MPKRNQCSDDVTTVATTVRLDDLGAALAFVKSFETFRGHVYARVKYARALEAHESGASKPHPIPIYDNDSPLEFYLPTAICTFESCTNFTNLGIKIIIASPQKIEAIEIADVKRKKATAFSSLQNFKNALIVPAAAAEILSAVGITRMDNFNSKIVADVEKGGKKVGGKIWELPKYGVSLKGNGVQSESTNRAVQQSIMALSNKIESEVRAVAKAETEAKTFTEDTPKNRRQHQRALESTAFAELSTLAARNPRFLVEHVVTASAFRKHLNADVPISSVCVACGAHRDNCVAHF